MRSYFIETWGCQMNHHDSEQLEGLLRRQGLARAQDPRQADLVVLNTCSVREKPVHKIASRIGALSKAQSPPRIGVCGCVAEHEGESLIERYPAVAFVLGPGQIGMLPEALRQVVAGERPKYIGFEGATEIGFDTVHRRSSTRGMVTVIEGCNEFCTFCIVPYTRGREASRPMTEVIDELHDLRNRGLREVELLGQTINAYRCPATGADFADLLGAVAGVPDLDRVRYITSHPRHFNDRLIEVLAEHDNLSRYLHLPFQAGSDAVLKRMNRKYSRGDYFELVQRIRSAIPDINISTDVIVGFPGESEQDFEQTLGMIEEVRFGQVFAFGFSPRPRTPGARYPHALDEQTKKNRLHRLFEISDRITLELNQRLVGETVSVLIDNDSRLSQADWQGRGDDNRVVNLPKTGAEKIGDLVDVRVTRAGPHSLFGEPVRASLSLPVLDPLRSVS
jgi:tRNA-2-methylthio-N6-dimethylallyladenosine synthase